MLYEFGVRNYFSFKEGVVISLKLDANCPKDISDGLDCATVLCIKGANASGKTNILKAISFISRFAAHSFNRKPDDYISIDSFFDSKEPSEFYVEFSANETTYRYELVCTDRGVVRETVFRKKSRITKIFERIEDEITECVGDFSELRTIKLRKNASIISTANQYQISCLDGLYDFFVCTLTNVAFGGYVYNYNDTIELASKYLAESKEKLSFVVEFLKTCDVGIADILISEHDIDDGKKEYRPAFLHMVDGKIQAISKYTESSGTKALFCDLLSYKMALDSGGLLILDEFDNNLHPHILPKLLELFVDPKKNPRRAQFIFSSHNSEILDSAGRYRTYLVNKNNNESFAYRLDEIPGDVLRNDRSIVPAYNDGKIGGTPKL